MAHPLTGDITTQRLFREYIAVREHNANATGQPTLLFSEGALVLVLVERFLRVLLGPTGTDATLSNLLELAMSRGRDLLDPPLYFPGLPLARSIEASRRVITSIRNELLHGNFEQAAASTNAATADEYFAATGAYRRDLDEAHDFLLAMAGQFDRETGERLTPTLRSQGR